MALFGMVVLFAAVLSICSFIFFFSSRRRHTRSLCDWSSDVCSSDLSTADLKALVGRHGGAVCTSSNARAVMEWSFRQKPRVLFFPDQHLGRNTGARDRKSVV